MNLFKALKQSVILKNKETGNPIKKRENFRKKAIGFFSFIKIMTFSLIYFCPHYFHLSEHQSLI